MNIFLKFQGETRIVDQIIIKDLINQNEKNNQNLFFIRQGRRCDSSSLFRNYQTVYAEVKLLGGKGGFGAKLKTEGGKKVRPNQNMFSRDLQGQPVSYSTLTRQYEQYYKKKLLQDQKVSKQLAQFKVVSNTYKQDYVSNKLDGTYNAQIQQNERKLKEAMKIGMKKYFEKKQQQSNKQSLFIPQKDYDVQDAQVENDNQQKQQQQGVKRLRPICDRNNEQQQQQQPVKKVKLNQQNQKDRNIQQKKEDQKQKQTHEKQLKKPSGGLLSAKQKLKSLFKK